MQVLFENINTAIINQEPPFYLNRIPFRGVYTYSRLFDCALFAYNKWSDAPYTILSRKQRGDNNFPNSKVVADFLVAITQYIHPTILNTAPPPIKLFYDYCLNERDNDGVDLYDGEIPRCAFCGTYKDLKRVSGSWICYQHLDKARCSICRQVYPKQWFESGSNVHIGCQYGEYVDFEYKTTLISHETKYCPRCGRTLPLTEFKVGALRICKRCHAIDEKNRVRWHKLGGDVEQYIIQPRKECPRCNRELLFESFEINTNYYDGHDIICKECKKTISTQDLQEIWTVEKKLQELAKNGTTREDAEALCQETVGMTLEEVIELQNKRRLNKIGEYDNEKFTKCKR